MPVEEMAKQSPYYIKFLQALLITTLDLSEEDFITLTEECRINFEVPATAKFNGEGG